MVSMTIILYNPLSKNRKSKRTVKKLVDYYKKHSLPFRIKSLLKIHDLEHYLNKTPKNIKIILLGGDGTINTFINNTMEIPLTHDISLKPTGSGNDFLRSLRKQRPRYQYIMKMETNTVTRHFINGCGMGIDGLIANYVNDAKRKNRLNYFKNTLKALFLYKPKFMNVTIDDQEYHFKKAYLINVNNGMYIGGGMKLSPRAVLEEDNFDVVIVHGIPKLFIFFIFLSVYLGLHTLFKRYVFYKKATYVNATMHHKEVAQCDGETFPNAQYIEITSTHKRSNFKVY